ncbi:MAG: phage holin family protein [Candidatus Goldbacteria bacterium]|nr:phage holin family protein [Candidatus Goldiibacteriota bacterium]
MYKQNSFFKNILIKWIINTIALFAVVKIIKGINLNATGFDAVIILAVTAAIIGIINAFIRPIILFLTLPINILTFGLLTFLINGILFGIASLLVKGFEITSLWSAIIGYIVFSIISFILTVIIVDN